MKYLNFTTVLPLGSPPPDLSGQPALNDFIPPALWKRRLELRDHQARYEEQPAQEPEHPDAAQFRKASQKWLQAVRQHTQNVENAHNIEFCNWSVHSTNQPGTGPIIWISHAEHADGEEHPYTIQGVFRLINNPAALPEIPGWDRSSKLHQQALQDTLHLFLQQENTT